MSETVKKALLAVVIVAAAAFAVLGALRYFRSDQPEVVRVLPGVKPENSMKRQEMEAQQKGSAVGESVVNGAPVQGEKDLGGSLK